MSNIQKNNFVTIIITLLISIQVYGQATISINNYLSKTSLEEDLMIEQKKNNFLNNTSLKLPVIEKFELRTETNEFDIKKQDYLVRVSPNSSKTIRFNTLYQNTIKSSSQYAYKLSFSRALKNRYDLLINYIYRQDIIESKERLKILLQDKITLYSRSIQLANFDLLDLINAEENQQKNDRDIADLKNEYKSLEQALKRTNYSSNTSEISAEELISIDQIEKVISKLSLNELTKHPQLISISSRNEINRVKKDIESSKSKFSLSYIQAKYGGNPNDVFKKKFSIGIGFDLPFKNSNNINIAEEQLKIFDSNNKYSQQKKALESEAILLKTELLNALKKFKLLKQQIESDQSKQALRKYQELSVATPKTLLKLKEISLSKELLITNLRLQIMKIYIDYLDALGVLTKQPYTNYLSNNLLSYSIK